MDEETTVETHLEKTEGFNFRVFVTKKTNFFGCPGWRGLAKAYMFEVGMDLYLDTTRTAELDIMVHLPTLPRVHLCKFS